MIVAEGTPVQVACRVVGVSEAGWYESLNRPPSERSIRHAMLTDLIRQIHLESRGIYGGRRVHAELTLGRGIEVGHVLTDIGPVELAVPRDREGTFEPRIVKKRQRRLDGVDQIVLSLTARGLMTGEVAAHFADVYDAQVSKDTISRITDKVIGEMAEWQTRPLDRVYPVILIDVLVVKVRDGQVTNRPFYVVIGVTTSGERDILGIWAGDGGEGAKLWLQVLTEIKNRGVEDVCIAVCDGLKGLPDAIAATWEVTQVQTCIIHLIRNTFRYAARQYWEKMAKGLRPTYTAVNAERAAARLDDFEERWGAFARRR